MYLNLSFLINFLPFSLFVQTKTKEKLYDYKFLYKKKEHIKIASFFPKDLIISYAAIQEQQQKK